MDLALLIQEFKIIRYNDMVTTSHDPNIWGWPWILNRLVRVSHMYYFPSFYSIWSHIPYYGQNLVTNLVM